MEKLFSLLIVTQWSINCLCIYLAMLGECINTSAEMLGEFVEEMEAENLNVTLAEGWVTWSAREQESAIDCVLVNGRMHEIVPHVWVGEDGFLDTEKACDKVNIGMLGKLLEKTV